MKTLLKFVRRVNVSRLDILDGRPGDSARCAVTLAVRRAIKSARYVHVVPHRDARGILTGSVSIGVADGTWFLASLPKKASSAARWFDLIPKFIRRADRLKYVKPFSFTLRAVSRNF